MSASNSSASVQTLNSNPVLQAIIQASTDVVVIINTKGIVVAASKGVAELFGISVDELVGQKVNCLMPEPHRSRHDKYIERYLKTKVPFVLGE